MSNPSLVIVLVEDQRQEMLVYKYLRRCGLEPHDIRIRTCPIGLESADGWVLSKFAAEAGEYRNRQMSKGETALTVMIDADDNTVEHRWTQMDQALAKGGEKKISERERIVRLVPKRNVETWILCLTSERELDEDTNYKRREKHKWHDLIPTAAETLREWTRPRAELPAHCVRSLRLGVQELKRLDS